MTYRVLRREFVRVLSSKGGWRTVVNAAGEIYQTAGLWLVKNR